MLNWHKAGYNNRQLYTGFSFAVKYIFLKIYIGSICTNHYAMFVLLHGGTVTKENNTWLCMGFKLQLSHVWTGLKTKDTYN